MARRHSPLWEEARALAIAAGARADQATGFADTVREGDAALVGLRAAITARADPLPAAQPIPITAAPDAPDAADAADAPDTDDSDLSWADDATLSRLAFYRFYITDLGRLSETDTATPTTPATPTDTAATSAEKETANV